MEALHQPTIRVVVIVAEGLPEHDARKLIAYARANNKVIIGPATVGGVQVRLGCLINRGRGMAGHVSCRVGMACANNSATVAQPPWAACQCRAGVLGICPQRSPHFCCLRAGGVAVLRAWMAAATACATWG